MGQVPAVGQVEAQHDVARLQGGQVDGRVGLGAGMRLDVGMLGRENLLDAIAGQVFGDVDELATAVVAMPGIALGVFIRQHAAHGLHDGRAGIVFRSDHLQTAPLAVDLTGDSGPQLWVLSFDRGHGEHPVEGSRVGRLAKKGKYALSAAGPGSSIGRGAAEFTVARHFGGWIARPWASTGCSMVSFLPRAAARFGKS